MKSEKENSNELSLTHLKVTRINSTHKDSQSKLREILERKREKERSSSNDSEFSL